jgi:hypothetical protein
MSGFVSDGHGLLRLGLPGSLGELNPHHGLCASVGPAVEKRLNASGRHVRLGQERQLGPLYDRLRQLGIDEPTEAARTVEALTGRKSPAHQASYRERRKQLLLALLDQYADQVDNAAEEIGAFLDHLRQVGVRGLVAEQLDDSDYAYWPELVKKPAKDGEGGSRGDRAPRRS